MLTFLILILLLWFSSEIIFILRKDTLKYVGVCNLVLNSSGKKGEKAQEKENWTDLQIQEIQKTPCKINSETHRKQIIIKV